MSELEPTGPAKVAADVGPGQALGSIGPADSGASPDGPLAGLRSRLEHVDDTPLDQRPALLEEANAALVDALGDLEEV